MKQDFGTKLKGWCLDSFLKISVKGERGMFLRCNDGHQLLTIKSIENC